MAMEIIITARPKVMPAMAIRTMGRVPEIVLLSARSVERIRRFAIKMKYSTGCELRTGYEYDE